MNNSNLNQINLNGPHARSLWPDDSCSAVRGPDTTLGVQQQTRRIAPSLTSREYCSTQWLQPDSLYFTLPGDLRWRIMDYSVRQAPANTGLRALACCSRQTHADVQFFMHYLHQDKPLADGQYGSEPLLQDVPPGDRQSQAAPTGIGMNGCKIDDLPLDTWMEITRHLESQTGTAVSVQTMLRLGQASKGFHWIVDTIIARIPRLQDWTSRESSSATVARADHQIRTSVAGAVARLSKSSLDIAFGVALIVLFSPVILVACLLRDMKMKRPLKLFHPLLNWIVRTSLSGLYSWHLRSLAGKTQVKLVLADLDRFSFEDVFVAAACTGSGSILIDASQKKQLLWSDVANALEQVGMASRRVKLARKLHVRISGRPGLGLGWYLDDVCKHIPKLAGLDLSDNAWGDGGAVELADAMTRLVALTDLNLAQCQIGPKGAGALAAALLVDKRLEKLNMAGNSIGADGLCALTQALEVNTTLRELHLPGPALDEASAKALVAMLHAKSLPFTLHLVGRVDASAKAVLDSAAFSARMRIDYLGRAGT